MFVLEIEYLNGVSYASEPTNRNKAEWPPHPDRVFMSLVASWGESEKHAGEADALRWLESQNPPEVFFPDSMPRSDFRSFVPVSGNSEKIEDVLSHKKTKVLDINSSIKRKERSFSASILPDGDHKIHFLWRNSEPSQDIRDDLYRLACRVSHIGHSMSLVRVAVVAEMKHGSSNRYVQDDDGYYFLRCPYAGRFDSLTSEFEMHANRLGIRFEWRPDIAPTYKYKEYGISPPPRSAMGNEWLILSCHGDVPVMETFPRVAKKMRDAIMSHTKNPISEIISGHNADGTILQKPHLAIVPMANVGWKNYSDGRLLGMALVLPKKSNYGTTERRQLLQAVSKLLESDKLRDKDQPSNDAPNREGLEMNPHGRITLRRDDGLRSSLRPDRYVTKAKTWVSATPVVLDQHPKKNHSAEEIIVRSCVNIGFPRPDMVKVSRYSMVSGAPAAYLARKSIKGWLSPKPEMFDNRFVCHVMLSFTAEICGPVIIGAGRYYGMGLCLPYDSQERI